MALRDVIGQDRAVTILLKTIERERIPSSYLFTGDSGIGKKFTALNLAKTLNCLTPSSPHLTKGGNEQGYPKKREGYTGALDACDECPSCKKITAGIHPDFLLISPEGGQIRIEEIRAIDDVLALKAFEGRKKVVIVDDAEAMNPFAANAFLKTLEEPPQDSLIILISSSPDLLPDTIRSRCSTIRFAPLSDGACEEVLKKIMVRHLRGKEKKSGKTVTSPHGREKYLPEDDLQLSDLIRLSMGRPGNAMPGDIIEERSAFVQLIEEMLRAEKDGWASKEEMERWFEFILIFLRDMAAWHVSGEAAVIINRDLKTDIEKLSRETDLQGIIKIHRTLNSIRGHFRFHLNKALTWNYTGSLLRKTFGVHYV
ncbi:MAG: DNA polymerase III subunit [Thermodesulfovibrionales bacterium]|nr:DNA polymerase III subunit [Thermodesulfovibrionales bacterium]